MSSASKSQGLRCYNQGRNTGKGAARYQVLSYNLMRRQGSSASGTGVADGGIKVRMEAFPGSEAKPH